MVSELLKKKKKKKEKVANNHKTMERTKRKSVAKQGKITRRNIGTKTIGNKKRGEREKCTSAERKH